MNPISPMTPIDRFIAAHGRLPADFFPAIDAVCLRIGVNLLARPDAPVRHMGRFESRLSGRGAPTPAYVLFTTFSVLPNVLGYMDEDPNFGDWRFWHPTGMAQIFHELWHVHQCIRDGRAAMLRAFAGGVIRSIPHGKLWSHAHVPMEREAMRMQERFRVEAAKRPSDFSWLRSRWL